MLALVDSSGISFLFFLGVIFIPRLMLLWLGAVRPESVGAIAGFGFVPRIMICSLLSASYGSHAPGSLVVLWIFAVVIDVVGFIVKTKFFSQMMKAQMEAFQYQRRMMGL